MTKFSKLTVALKLLDLIRKYLIAWLSKHFYNLDLVMDIAENKALRIKV
nr:hypothetical protein [Mycoplasmopsis bovis]